MGLVLVLCIVAIAILLLPDAFARLWSGMIGNPEWGAPFLTVAFVIAIWIHRR